MDDDYDIYGDLEGFEIETRKENQIVKELNAEIEELKAKIVEKESEKDEITKQNGILLENISSLLLTAKAEIKRKDSLISDIRRQRDDNAFRRQPRTVRKCDKGTQTTLIRLLSQAAQTESVGSMTDIKMVGGRGRDRERKRSQSPSREDRRVSENSRHRERVPYSDLRNKLRDKKTGRRPELNNIRRNRRATRVHDRERDRDQRARHRENRTPDLSPVEFPSLLRRPRKEVSNADSIAETKLKEAFIPMNERELDRYVKEMARSNPDRESPDVAPLETVSNSDLWDVQNKKKSSKKNRREDKAAKEEHIIQSDEIGTTGVGTILSPEKIEDVEQKMRALHGESTPSITNFTPESAQTSIELLNGLSKSADQMDTSQPPALVIPPPEPSIIELVPELSFEDDQRLNDSRELRIVESEDAAAEPDERCSSAETVIEMLQRASQEEAEDLEEGEVVSSDESQPAHGSAERFQPHIPQRLKATTSVPKLKRETKPERTPKRRDGKARILLDKLSDSVIRKHSRSGNHHRGRHDGKSSRRERKRDSSKHDRPPPEHLKTSTPNRVQTTRRKSQRLSDARDEQLKETAKARLSDPDLATTREDPVDEHALGKSRKESLKELFGTDDENSLFGTPEKVSGKRRHSETRDNSDDRKKPRVCVEGRADREERASKEVGSNKGFKSKGCDKIRVSSEKCPEEVASNSKLNEPILVDSSSEDVPESLTQNDRLAQENKHQPSKLEIAAKTPVQVNDTVSKCKDRVRSNSSSKDTNSKDELAGIHTNTSKRVRETAKTEGQPVPDISLNESNKSAPKPQILENQPSQPSVEMSSPRKRRNSGKRNAPSYNSVSTTDVIGSNTSETREPKAVSKESSRFDQTADKSLQNLPRIEVQSSTSPLQSKKPSPPSKNASSTSAEIKSHTLEDQATQEAMSNESSQQSGRELDTVTEVTAKVAKACQEDLLNKPIQLHVREPKEQQFLDLPSSEACSSAETGSAEPPTPMNDSYCQPKQSELVSEQTFPETPPDSKTQLSKTPQVIVYSNKYGEYRVEDNSETEVTIYVTRKKRRSRKSNHASPNVSNSGLDVK
ncbi:caldesmon [Aedes albopictus]|uniref:Shugoshin C-terminal domain-containing protein n=1 Tax=Aedes albopictus TaxID=7160 RepID=A0ABM1Z8K5_AEDAL